jgi:[calcium/calmodulin-dependent protein kinase] kinase
MQSYDEDLILLFDPQDPVITTTLQDPPNRRYKLNQYIRGEKIGKGKHGDVYLCKDEAGGHDLVCSSLFLLDLVLTTLLRR